jgi:hypothetical protein
MQLGALKGLSIGYQVVKDAVDRIGSQAWSAASRSSSSGSGRL